MSYRRVTSTILIVVVFLSCGNLRAQPSPTEALNALVAALAAYRIGKVEVIAMPRDAETIMRMTPQALRDAWSYKTTIRQLAPDSRDRLLKVLRSAMARPSTVSANVRRGVVFYLTDGEVPFLSLFFEGRSDLGYVNGTQVRFDAGFTDSVIRAVYLSAEQP